MSDRWQVWRADGSVVGPFSALEIRDALRIGQIDPFDKVSRVGSKLRQPLVEVDEIFAVAKVDEAQFRDSVYEADDSQSTQVTLMPRVAAAGVSTQIATPQVSRPKQTQRRPPPQSPRKNPKRYYLVDRNLRYHGPLSSSEIQALYFRGLVDGSASVAKDRNGPRIPAKQFVSASMGRKNSGYISEITKFNIVPGEALPSTKVIEQRARALMLAQPIGHQIPVWQILAVVAALVFLAFVVGLQWSRTPSAVQKDVTAVVANPSAKPSLPTPESVQEQRPLPDLSLPKKQTPTRKAKKATRPKGTPNRPANVVVPPRAIQTQAGPKPGTMVKFQGSYAVAELEACGLKCRLSFRDTSGRRYTAVFFKAQYEGVLRQKAGRAMVTGRVSQLSASNIEIFLLGLQ